MNRSVAALSGLLIPFDCRLLALLDEHPEGVTMKDVFVLLATNNYLKVRYRLRKLGAWGLLKWSWRDGEKRFFITHKGSTVLREAR
jgi:predicted MarR family transcription regulator